LFEGRTMGSGQRTVLGIGLNVTAPSDSKFAGLAELSQLAEGEDLLAQLHAVVASMFEVLDAPIIPLTVPSGKDLDEALVFGSLALGPVLYRGGEVHVSGLNNLGSLRFETELGANILLDDPDELEWSNI